MTSRFPKQYVADGMIESIETALREVNRIDIAKDLCKWWRDHGQGELKAFLREKKMKCNRDSCWHTWSDEEIEDGSFWIKPGKWELMRRDPERHNRLRYHERQEL